MIPQTKPVVGYLDIADPRLGPLMPEIFKTGKDLTALLTAQGLKVISARQVIDTEPKAREAVEQMRRQGACGVVLRIAWFHRSNVTVAAAQCGLPCFLWTVCNRNHAGLVGLGVAHGALDEVGLNHQLHYGEPAADEVRPIIAWAQACRVKQALWGAVYGEVGGRCLEMIPMSADDNQLRKLFGVHVDPIEQWNLIHRAEAVDKQRVQAQVKQWRKAFKSIHCAARSLERSARIYLAGKELFRERGWAFAGIQCQLEMIDNYLAPCLPIAKWNDDGLIIACENDINNALGMFLIKHATGRPAMFADVQHYDLNRNIIRLLNCGTNASTLAGGDRNVELRECPPAQGSWDPVKRRSMCQGGACSHFLLPPGPVTIVRLGRIDGRYVLHLVEGEAVQEEHNPKELLGICGVWPFAYVRPRCTPDEFIHKMRAHHCTVATTPCADIVREFARLYRIEIL